MASKIVTNAAKQAQRLRLLVASINRSALDVIDEAVGFIKQKMQVEPGRLKKITWDSLKQQKFVMAMLRERGDIPYTRTHAHVEGFTQERSDNSVSLSNAHPAAAISGFYMGWQSNIHRGNWPNLTVVVDDVMADVPQKIQDQIYKEATAVLRSD